MKTLIFDFGNVVAFFDHRRASRQLACLGRNSVAESAIYQGIFDTSLEASFDCGKISARDFIERLKVDFDLVSSDEAIVKAWCDIFWLNPGVVSLLPRLQESSVQLLLASNTNELHFQWVLSHFAEPLGFFEDFVLSYQIGCRKPAPAFFHKCVETARTGAKDCIYIDDRPEFVEAARAIGMAGIVYSAGMDLLQPLRSAGVKVR
jgi:glucose-1-phosphatase